MEPKTVNELQQYLKCNVQDSFNHNLPSLLNKCLYISSKVRELLVTHTLYSKSIEIVVTTDIPITSPADVCCINIQNVFKILI